MRGLDYSAGTIAGQTIRGAGYDFVIRYVGTPGRRKNITRGEYNDLVSAGVTVWLAMENDVNDILGGFSGGQANARAARADADAIGYPPGGVIFFCADRHLAAGEIPTALSYIDGASDVLGHGSVGVYGFWEFVDAAIAGGHGSYYWQCGIAPDATDPVHLWQRNPGNKQGLPVNVTLNGVLCDINDLLRPIGGPVGPAPAGQLPGGIETMAFGDKFTDWAGNSQDVLSWMNHMDQKIAELHSIFLAPGSEPSRIPGDTNMTNLRDAIMDSTSWANQTLGHAIAAEQHAANAEAEVTKQYTSIVPGSTYQATAGQMATNADGYGYELTQKVNSLEAKVDAIIAALNNATIVPKR